MRTARSVQSVAAKTVPDGYTLLFDFDALDTLRSLMPHMNFDPNKALLPIAMVGGCPLVVVASGKAPFDDVKGLLDTAKRSAHRLEGATPGRETLNHLVGEWIEVAAHIKLVQIPYSGGAAALSGIAAGDVPFGIVSPIVIYPGLVAASKIKVIALTSRRRPAFLPSSWSTLAENGLPIDASVGLGLFAPAGTSDAIVSRVDQAIDRTLQDDSVRKRMNDLGINPEHIGPAAFVERIRNDEARYEEIIRRAGTGIER